MQAQLIEVACALCGRTDSRFERTVDGFVLERCRRCGLVFANPQYSIECLEQLYSGKNVAKMIELYSRIASPTVLEDYRRTLDLLELWLPGRGRLLDFG